MPDHQVGSPRAKRRASSSPAPDGGVAAKRVRRKEEIEEDRRRHYSFQERSTDYGHSRARSRSRSINWDEGHDRRSRYRRRSSSRTKSALRPRFRSPSRSPNRAGNRDRSRQKSPPRARRLSVTDQHVRQPPTANVTQEEKKRGRRLFGGLLNALNQNRGRAVPQAPRRTGMAKQQEVPPRNEESEEEKRRKAKLARLTRIRRIVQVQYSEQVMRTMHVHKLALAHNLTTGRDPRRYFRPRDLTREEERTIQNQIRAAKDTIEREEREYQVSREQKLKEFGVQPRPRAASHVRSRSPDVAELAAPVGDPSPVLQDANTTPARSPSPVLHAKDNEDTADEMEQDKEDLVLY